MRASAGTCDASGVTRRMLKGVSSLTGRKHYARSGRGGRIRRPRPGPPPVRPLRPPRAAHCKLLVARRLPMPRITRAALIQASNPLPGDSPLPKIKAAMIEKHLPLIKQAADKGAQICCLQEIFYGPYFCAEQQTKWYETAEPIPDGPTIKLM